MLIVFATRLGKIGRRFDKYIYNIVGCGFYE